MNRREWLKRAALAATGAIAADQLDLLERLTHKRRFFPSADFQHTTYSMGFWISQEMIEDDRYYIMDDMLILQRKVLDQIVTRQRKLIMPRQLLKTVQIDDYPRI